ILTDMGKALVSLERIQEILNQEQEDFNENGLTPEIKGNIKLENVYFKYEGEEKPVINNISLEVEKGQTIAISGPTGSGKSSLMYLLTGLYDCQKGNIYLDGIDISKMNKKWLRKNVGLVLQEPFLYARSIKENIAISEKKVNESKIYDAAKTAAIHDVIQDFEDGYNTFVGERGVSLSGGQKQRIAIARTIINDSPILIFDDSLSAVDTETDAAIRKALNERNKDTTTFIISHRVTTLAEADVILVLDEGKIVQKGTHEELITQPGMYQRIWNMQNILEQEMEAETEDRELI
ncbi:MAG: ABC transporter ATP-binding protein, partial [Halanaerobiales bacterium]